MPARNIFPARETITTDAPTGTPTIVREQPNKAKSVFSKGLASDTNTVSNGMPISTPGKVSIIRAAPPDGNVSQAVHHVNTFARGAQITSYAPATIESLPLRTTFDLFKYNDGSCWHCSPFTLVPINDGIVCPRLVVKPSSVLAEPMGIGHYPLGPAIAKLHCLRHSHRPMPHEAMIILDWFRKNNTIKPIDQNVTLLDPLIYGSFGIYSQDQLEGFRMAEWCWLTLVGEPLQFKDYFSGTCRLEEIFPNYDKLTITLILSFGDGQEVYWPLKRGISPFL